MEFQRSANFFLYCLFAVCGFYLVAEFFVNRYIMLSVDDFWFAHHAYKYKTALPYRDFMPYKTVLGYYLLILPLNFFSYGLHTLINTKQVIAGINACVWFVSACWLTRFFSKSGVLLSLTALVIAENVLSYSTNIRVDLFAYWFGLFAMVLLLEKRYWLAGILLGLGFITSQKMIWYIFASNFAVACYGVMLAKPLKTIRHLIQTNFACLFVILIYLAFWSYWSSWHTVIQSVWSEASAMYQLDWYNAARIGFWHAIICLNPLLFLLWPLTFLSLFVTYPEDTQWQARVFISFFGAVILFCLIPYKQVFPYYMQATYPVLLVLYSGFFSWMIGFFNARELKMIWLGKRGVYLFLIAYAALIVYLSWYLSLPLAYLLMITLPFIFYILINEPSQNIKNIITPLFVITFVFFGVIYPNVLFITKLVYSTNTYQQKNIALTEALLDDGSDYVAGLELFYNKNQPIAGLKHLMGPAVDYLYAPTPKLRNVMLPSLDEDPNVSVASIIADLKQSRVKLYVNNYRIDALPPVIKEFLAQEYEHFWGSIYLYAPTFPSHQTKLFIKFSGFYKLKAATPIELDGHVYAPESRFYLAQGEHLYQTTHPFRLALDPNVASRFMQPEFVKDEWIRLV